MLSKALMLAGWAVALILGLAIAREKQPNPPPTIAPAFPPAIYHPITPTGTIKIEEIGDSLTYGLDETVPGIQNINCSRGGYRKPLYTWLSTHNYRPVGSVIAGDVPTWDWHCEAHSGATTADIASRYPVYSQGIHPDVAILMIGTNDLIYHIPLSQSLPNMATIWSEIYRQNPKCDLYVSSILPLRGYKTQQLNMAIASQVASLQSTGSRIHYVDMYHLASLDPQTDFGPNGIHPSPSGYAKIARVWISVLSRR